MLQDSYCQRLAGKRHRRTAADRCRRAFKARWVSRRVKRSDSYKRRAVVCWPHSGKPRWSLHPAEVGCWPQTAVEGCRLFRRCRGRSRHLANGPRPPPLTHSRQPVWCGPSDPHIGAFRRIRIGRAGRGQRFCRDAPASRLERHVGERPADVEAEPDCVGSGHTRKPALLRNACSSAATMKAGRAGGRATPQYFACPGVRGNGIASRTLESPVT